jgi:hypothetical protein
VSSELLLRLPCAVGMIFFRDRCKRGSGWEAGAAISSTGSACVAQTGILPNEIAQSPELELLTCVTDDLRRDDDGEWLEHFLLMP